MTRQTRKSGKIATKKPIVNVDTRREMHVPDCMVWPDPHASKSGDTDRYQATDKVIPKKAELGKPLDRGYTVVGVTRAPVDPNDTALEAIRGWPIGSTQQPNHTSEFEDFMKGLGVVGAQGADPYKDYEITPRKQDATKSKKKGKQQKVDPKEDPNLHDLISHRFLYEAAMERQRKAAEKEREEAEMARLMKSKRFPKDIKATKASQLRSIAMAEKVETRPQDLWQMPRFKNSAKPCLQTKRQGSTGKSRGGKNTRGSGINGVDPHPTCTCAEDNGYKGADYDRYQEPDYPNVDYGDTKGADMVPMSPKDGLNDDGDVVAL